MGWQNTHLHAFSLPGEKVFRGRSYQSAQSALKQGEGVIPYENVSTSDLLPEVGTKVEFVYDFGDNWSHTLRRIKVPQNVPRPRGAG